MLAIRLSGLRLRPFVGLAHARLYESTSLTKDEALQGASDQFQTPLKFKQIEAIDTRAEKFLMEAALRSTETRRGKRFATDAIDWSEAMRFIEASEENFPTPKIEDEELFAITDSVITHNLAKVVDRSVSLKRLVDLGVNIWRWERNCHLDLALRLDYDDHVAPKIDFLHSHGVNTDDMLVLFEKNPHLLVETSMDEMHVRKDYLVKMGFSAAQITAILSTDPNWLSHAVEDIDSRLGFLQRTFELTAAELRAVAALDPKIVTWVGLPDQITLNMFSYKEEMGFNAKQIKKMLKSCPTVFRHKFEYVMMENFDALALEVGFPRSVIARHPESLLFPAIKIRERLELLRLAGRDQFDPKKANFVSISVLTEFSDEEFCKMVNVPLDTFDQFLKTL